MFHSCNIHSEYSDLVVEGRGGRGGGRGIDLTVSHLTNVNRVLARMQTSKLRDEYIGQTCHDSIREVAMLNS